jgi:uncharacterized protein DUF5681
MGDDYEVGHGKPPAKTKFQKGKSGNPSGRPKRRNPPNEPLDFQKGMIAEFNSLITINEAGNKKTVAKWQALLKAAYALSLKDPGMMKWLLNWIVKFPKEAFIDDKVYTFTVTQSQWDLMQAVEQDAATWLANSSEATNKEGD